MVARIVGFGNGSLALLGVRVVVWWDAAGGDEGGQTEVLADDSGTCRFCQLPVGRMGTTSVFYPLLYALYRALCQCE